MKLQDQDELARALFEEGGDAMFLLDPETDSLLDVNPVALRLTGFARSEVLRLPATSLFRAEVPGGSHALGAAFTKTTVFHAQDGYLLRTAEGSAWVPVSLTVSRLHVAPRTLGLVVARDDRERRAALAQARKVETELRSVLASAPAALWSAVRSAGSDGHDAWQFRHASPRLAEIAGRPPKFPESPKRWAEAVHPADHDAYREAVRGLLAGPADEVEQEYRVQTPGGAVRWVRDRLRVRRDAAGRPTRLDGCVTDVTDRRAAEEAVRQSERRFRALVEKNREGIALVDEEAVVRYASPASTAILGYDPTQMVGRSGFWFAHPDDVPVLRERFAYTLTHPGESVPSRFRAFAADGSVRVLELLACNRLDDPGVRAVVVNYRDVTERERAARELERQNALLEGLFASVPDAVCFKDRELRFLGGNPAFEALAGCPVSALVGKTCREVFTAEWAARFRAIEPGVLETGVPVRAREWVAYPGGRPALLDFVISPLRGPGGETTGLIIVGRDVTDREQLEEALRQAAKLEAVGRLAGGIAHDFNNLLTVVLGNLELVRSGAPPADAAELLASAEGAARQAAELTRQMLGFARRQPIQPTTVDLNALARQELTLLRRSIDPRVEIAFTPAPDLPAVTADPVQVQQVLMNLCLNARDAMPDGGTLTIETASAGVRPGSPPADTTLDSCFVRLSVADTGDGMTDEVRARVFEPFFTTKEVGRGTGLGLAVVYGVARAHGGWVECHSAPGKGCRFDVYLPCAAEGEQPATGGLPGEPAVPRAGRGETVLLADDEAAVRSLAAAGLGKHGYRVVEATDGAEAVEAFRRVGRAVDLVVLDMMMPTMTGAQAFAAIRAIDPGVPVLFASGHPPADMLPDPLPPGVAYLPKPYTPTQLAAAARKLLDEAARTTPVG